MRPVVGIPCCTRQIGLHPFHIVGDKYIRAVTDGAGALPLLVPALGDGYDPDDLLDRLDGLLLTGSPSNVEPHHYAGPASREGTHHDPDRDSTTLPLIRRALDRGIPSLFICRGIQELNVARGGTLHQNVHELDDRFDHRADEDDGVEVQYGPAHRVLLTVDGTLARLFGKVETTVNSIHSQGIDRVGDGLAIEAVAEDGQVESVRVTDAPGFALAVQWHPEWRFWENPDSRALFRAFGRAVEAGADGRGRTTAAYAMSR